MNTLTRQKVLESLIRTYAPTLQPLISWTNPLLLLAALAEVESSFGENIAARHESSHDLGGRWVNKSYRAAKGALVACSYSSFQIIAGVAVELGFDPDRDPTELSFDEIAIPYVMEYIKKRILARGAQTVRQFAIGYNGGSPMAESPQTLAYATRFDFAMSRVLQTRLGGRL